MPAGPGWLRRMAPFAASQAAISGSSVVGPAVQHDVGDGGAEGRHGRELLAVAAHGAGQRAGAGALWCDPGAITGEESTRGSRSGRD
jgi:hypothetical protein